MSNSLINPLIYGAFQLWPIKRRKAFSRQRYKFRCKKLHKDTNVKFCTISNVWKLIGIILWVFFIGIRSLISVNILSLDVWMKIKIIFQPFFLLFHCIFPSVFYKCVFFSLHWIFRYLAFSVACSGCIFFWMVLISLNCAFNFK